MKNPGSIRTNRIKALLAVTMILLAAVLYLNRRGGDDAVTAGVGSSSSIQSQPDAVPADKVALPESDPEFRAVWVQYPELNFTGKTEAEFKAIADQMLDNIKERGLNAVFLHVRPFSDAFYKSSYFPWSKYLAGEQGKDPGYDPLEYFVQAAHQRDIQLHAWINPYRVSASPDTDALSGDNPARIWLDGGSAYDNYVMVCEQGIYYNPAIPEVKKLILDGVREIVENYHVDGIHFDDYFYPNADLSLDAKSYKAYLKSGGKLSQGDWRRANTNTLVSGVYALCKAQNRRITFGISPAAKAQNNYDNLFADVYTWGSQPGYVDYLCPQIYFGFEHETMPFGPVAGQWNDLVSSDSVRLYAGLAVYKTGKTADELTAGDGNEWSKHDDLIKRQVEYIRKLSRFEGFALFSYGYTAACEAEAEMNILITIL